MNTWKHCSVHGPGDENSWGCPECVRELRKAVAERDARIQQEQKHGVMARRIRDAFNKGSSLGREARDQEVAELKAKIAGLEGRIQGMLESKALGKGE